ncbi:hemin uptake protein HemP [Hydrogenophaga sp.]|uniref:hemin uptake protein HemP n=1 Tax=Hydrogenophaga sp. TaxID=1904254 RepID=UPI0027310936|nr:hemin uptake protein HemP [Hydrogenophaga sp.]MDP2017120.1 hemin uptake protein HemP [Hydrogenophaga sp.]
MNTEPRLDPSPEPVPAARETEPRDDVSPSLTSDSLLRGQKAVTISHNGSVYRLQATRQGKLILTK